MSLVISFQEGFSINERLSKKLQDITKLIFAEEKEAEESSINLRILGNAEIQELNKQFRDKDKTTNVLSFVNNDISIEKTNNIGDIAISYDFVLQEAKEEHKNFDDHLVHMLAHGVYHILGYDHEDEARANIMESKGINILEKVHIENPYN